MNKHEKCNMVNIGAVILFFGSFAAIPNIVFGWLGFVPNLLIFPVALVAAGYFVQYIVSKYVNRVFYGKELDSDIDNNCEK